MITIRDSDSGRMSFISDDKGNEIVAIHDMRRYGRGPSAALWIIIRKSVSNESVKKLVLFSKRLIRKKVKEYLPKNSWTFFLKTIDIIY